MGFLDDIMPADSVLGELFDLDGDGHVSIEEAIVGDHFFLNDPARSDSSIFGEEDFDDPDLDEDEDEDSILDF